MEDVGNLLEAHGVQVEREDGATLGQLCEQLAEGHKVIAGVNAEEIWSAVDDKADSTPFSDYPGAPWPWADHAVEVIGIDESHPSDPLVVLNDPGTPDGRGLEVPADVFAEAWAASDHFLVHTV
jgi:hypothetical protein